MDPTRNETHIRAHALARLPILCAERLRGAVVLSAAFEPADTDHVTRGYVAWQRSDECGTHAFTFHLREIGGMLTIGKGGSDAELHSGHYNLSTRGALLDASDRLTASYIADEQRLIIAACLRTAKLCAERANRQAGSIERTLDRVESMDPGEPYTVIGVYSDNEQPFAHVVRAVNASEASRKVSESGETETIIAAVLRGDHEIEV